MIWTTVNNYKKIIIPCPCMWQTGGDCRECEENVEKKLSEVWENEAGLYG